MNREQLVEYVKRSTGLVDVVIEGANKGFALIVNGKMIGNRTNLKLVELIIDGFVAGYKVATNA